MEENHAQSRNLTQKERSIFRSLIGIPPFIVRIGVWAVLFLCSAGGLLIITLVVQKLIPVPNRFELPIVSVIGAVSLVAALCLEDRRSKRFASKEQLRELREGIANVFSYRTDQVVLIAESQNGHGALARLASGKTLYLLGPYLSELISDGKFPCHTFSVVMTPITRTVLGVICTDEPISPVATLPRLPRTVFTERGGPEDGDVLDIDFRALIGDAKADKT